MPQVSRNLTKDDRTRWTAVHGTVCKDPMSYQVLARKWRPQTFESLIGQQPVTQTLKNAIRQDRVAHAFLFSGVRGVGKTSAARILAMALNCGKGISEEPCGECDSCLEIAASSSVDVLEIDAASNTGIDNIREIRASVRYRPARDRFKIFIIDEVHMLSRGAFNALLKTLEEPPSHVKFVLATTESHKIPETIASRCQHFEFKRIPFAVIVQRLRHICDEEAVEISDYGLQAIAAAAQGSMRDGLSALDRVRAFGGSSIEDQEVITLLGVIDDSVVIALSEKVVKRDRQGLLGELSALAESGLEAQNVVRKMLQHVRNLTVCKIVGWDDRLLQLPDSFREPLLQQSEAISHLELIRFYDLLVRVEDEMRLHHNPHLHLEMALMRLVELAGLSDLEEVISGLQNPESGPSRPLQNSAPEEKTRAGAAEGKPLEKSAISANPASADGNVVDQLMSGLQKENLPLHASLSHAGEMTHEGDTLRIVFEADAAFHYRMLEPEKQNDLARLCGKLTGRETAVEVKLKEDGVAVEQLPIDEPAVQEFLKAFPGKYIVEAEKGK